MIPGFRRRLCLEALEDRTLLAGHTLATATPLAFSSTSPVQSAAAYGFLNSSTAVDLYAVQLTATATTGDMVTVTLAPAVSGSSVSGELRVFDSTGHPLFASDNANGTNATLTFQMSAPGTNTYYVGVSESGNGSYDPTTAPPAGDATKQFIYDLTLTKPATLPALQPILVGSQLQVTSGPAQWGQAVTGAPQIDNRGGAAAGSFSVPVVLSTNSAFNGSGSDTVLTTLTVPGLAAGGSYSAPLSVTLPGTPPAGFPSTGPVYLGMAINGAPVGPHQGNNWDIINVLPIQFENEAAPHSNDTLATATALNNLNGRVSGGIASATDVDYYQVAIPTTGELSVNLHPSVSGLSLRLSLRDASDNVLATSDGAGGALDATLVQSLPAGTYYLRVEGLAGGTGGYTLTTQFTAGTLADQPVPVDQPFWATTNPESVAWGDFNGDGKLDFVTANTGGNTVSVVLGNGDGTFQTRRTFVAGNGPDSVAVGDVNGDGKLDLVAANRTDNTVSVLLGSGDGTFQGPQTFAVGNAPYSVAVGDFDNNGTLDIATANFRDNTVSVLLGNGNGTFRAQQTYSVGAVPQSLAVGDFNGDGKLDLAVANEGDDSVSVLQGNGDGSFFLKQTCSLPTGSGPVSVALGDFDANGKLDLVVANLGSTASVLLGNGDGTFQAAANYAVGNEPYSVAVGDCNGDGKPDLVTANHFDDTVSVLLGKGDGTFQPQQTFPTGNSPRPSSVAVGDCNGDGRVDLAIANTDSNNVSVLFGNGDGSFQSQRQQSYAASGNPISVAVGDFNGDGKPDAVTANHGSNTVSVLLGNGDGSFQPQRTFAAGSAPDSVAVGDLNGDGRLDFAVANQVDNTVSVLLGNGDGSFQPQHAFAAGNNPYAVAEGDFNGDGKPDLVVANRNDNTVSVLLGNGDGSFQPQRTFAAGSAPDSVAVGDFNGDGKLDLAVVDRNTNTVSVLLSVGGGNFGAPQPYAVGVTPVAVAVGDFNGDNHLDLVIANQDSNTTSVLLGNGDGTFSLKQTCGLVPGPGFGPQSVAVGDFNGDGKPDLVTANSGNNTVSVLYGIGDGTFQPQQPFATGVYPISVATGDFNGDGRRDIVTANYNGNTVSVLLNYGGGNFQIATISNAVPAVPLLANLGSAQVKDSVILRDDGTILYRQGVPTQPGTFAPPVTVNPASVPARDVALVSTSQGTLIAAVDRQIDPTTHLATVSLYAHNPTTGAFTRTPLSLTAADNYPTRILAANLTGGPVPQDLVVYSAFSGTVTVFLSNGAGGFQAPVSVPVGLGFSALATAPGQFGTDILLTNQISGEVTELVNDGIGHFSAGRLNRFRAAAGPSGWDGNTNGVLSLQGTAGLVVGNFSGSSHSDILTINPGGDALNLLPGQGNGSYLNPVNPLPLQPALGFAPGFVASGDFGNGHLDLAILDPQHNRVYIYLGDGMGHFKFSASYSAGNAPTGITVADVTRPGGGGPDGKLDLLIGNSYGDILVLPGKGDGTFLPYERVERGVPLVVADLDHNGQDDFIFADAGLDRVTVAYNSLTPTATLATQNSPQPVLGPGAVQLTFLGDDPDPVTGKDTTPDLVVANSGSNNVLVFRGDGSGGFLPAQSFFAGTSPAGITVADVNGDGTPDLVIANQGSNDVSVLYGKGSGAAWTMTYGPRLSSGGTGPVSTVVADVTGPNGLPDGIPDILASNSGSNTVAMLPGTGGGFFRDTGFVAPSSGHPGPTPPPVLIPVGARPGPLVAVHTPAGDGFVVLDSGDRTLTRLTNFAGSGFQTVLTVDAGGFNPVAVATLDVNTDGFTDLIVADNNTDGAAGNLVLLVGGAVGFDPVEQFSDPEVPHPSDVALSALHGDSEFYATSDGVEKAVPFFLNLPSAATGTTETAQTVALPGSSVAFAPQLVTRGPDLAPDDSSAEATGGPTATQPNIGRALLLSESGALASALAGENGALAFAASESPALNNLDLLLGAEGAKGGEEELAARWAAVSQGWLPRLSVDADKVLASLAGTEREALGGAGGLAAAVLRRLELDGLEAPELHWRELGGSLVDVTWGALRTTWSTQALDELRDRLGVALQRAAGPWMPAAEAVPVTLPAMEGGQELIRGLRSVLPEVGGLRLPGPLEAIPRPLFDSAEPTPPPPAPRRPAPLLAGAAPAREEAAPWDQFWLAAGAVGLAPAFGLLTRNEFASPREAARRPRWPHREDCLD